MLRNFYYCCTALHSVAFAGRGILRHISTATSKTNYFYQNNNTNNNNCILLEQGMAASDMRHFFLSLACYHFLIFIRYCHHHHRDHYVLVHLFRYFSFFHSYRNSYVRLP